MKCAIVEDDFLIASYLKSQVVQWGFDVCGMAPSADQAVELALREKPNVVLMDYTLKGQGDGVDASIEIASRLQVAVIFLTGSEEPKTIERIESIQPHAIFTKPVNTEHLKKSMLSLSPS